MENKDTFQKKLAEIKLGTLVHDDWTKYLNKIKILGSGNFGVVHLAEDPSNDK